MKTGIVTGSVAHMDFAEGMAHIRSLGYSCVDFGEFTDTPDSLFGKNDAEFSAYLAERRRIIEDAGLEISQTHGPWRCPPKDDTPEDLAERFEKMARSVYGTALLGCPYMVIHPIMPNILKPMEEHDDRAEYEMNLEFMFRLAEEGKRNGVTVCLENMPMNNIAIYSTTHVAGFLRELNHPNMKLCLDTGHSAIRDASPAEAVRIAGDLLRVLHVHDNDKRNDFHQMPYTGRIKWQEFIDALQESGFAGTLSLECNVPREMPDLAYRQMEIALHEIAEHLAGNR